MSAFIDPAESFSRALGQGLATFKQYRDEARMDDEIAFNRTMALKAEERAVNADKRAADLHNIALETNKYEVGRRPFREKVEQTQLEGYQLDNEGQRIDNEWKPKLNAETLRSSQDASARGWAGIRMEGARLSLARAEFAAQQEERDQRNAFKNLVAAIKTNDYSALTNNPKAAQSVLRLAGAAAGAPTLLAAMQNPTGSWLNDPKQKRAVLNVAAIDLGKTASNFGFRKGTVTIADLRPSKAKGMVNIDFVGLNPKTNKLEFRTGYMPAERLFDKTAVFANTMYKITNDPKARSAMVSAFRASDPEMYGEMLNYEISRREQAIKGIQDRSIKVADPRGMVADLQKEAMLLRNNDPSAIGDLLFPRMQKVGREYVQSHTTRAYDSIEGRMKNKDPKYVTSGINTVIERAARDPKYYAQLMKSAGLSASGGYDPYKVLQALGR